LIPSFVGRLLLTSDTAEMAIGAQGGPTTLVLAILNESGLGHGVFPVWVG
jgi:hypothetical protein